MSDTDQWIVMKRFWTPSGYAAPHPHLLCPDKRTAFKVCDGLNGDREEYSYWVERVRVWDPSMA